MLTEGPRDLILNVYIEIVHMHALFKWFIKQFHYHNHINRFSPGEHIFLGQARAIVLRRSGLNRTDECSDS